jgi:plastocyanin
MILGARSTTLALAVLVAVLVLAAAVRAAGRPPRAVATAVGVGAREYRLAVYRTSVPRGTVRFNLTNFGEDKHDLVIRDRRGRRLATSGEIAAGGRVVVRVRLRPGSYRLRCEVADHARRGMRATIVVR